MRRSAAYILIYKYEDDAFETFCQEKSSFYAIAMALWPKQGLYTTVSLNFDNFIFN